MAAASQSFTVPSELAEARVFPSRLQSTDQTQAAHAGQDPSRGLTVAASEGKRNQEQPRPKKPDSPVPPASTQEADLRREIENLQKALQARQAELDNLLKAQKKVPERLRRHRQLRWQLVFDTKDGEDYARQLAALGATLAIPEPGDRQQLRVFRDLRKRPVTGKVEDPSAIHSIYWVDDREAEVKGLAKALGLKTPPPYFITFFPDKLEKDLARKERSFAGHDPDVIDETVFKIGKNNKGEYEAKVISQRLSQIEKGK
jgi:hypothetical protein